MAVESRFGRSVLRADSARNECFARDEFSSKRIDGVANNGYACCSFGGFRLRPTPTTRSDEGSLRMKHALLEEGTNRAFYRLSTAIQQNSHQPPPEQKSSVKSTPLTISRRPRIIHSKKA